MTTLYSPDGEKYETSSKVEVTRLVAGHGYAVAETPAPKKVAGSKPGDKS